MTQEFIKINTQTYCSNAIQTKNEKYPKCPLIRKHIFVKVDTSLCIGWQTIKLQGKSKFSHLLSSIPRHYDVILQMR